LVTPPTIHRVGINGLADLKAAWSTHKTRVYVGCETGRIPFQSQVFGHALDFGARPRDEPFVVHFEQTSRRQRLPPMRHKPLITPEIANEFLTSRWHSGGFRKVRLMNGNRRVERIAPAMKNCRVREGQMYQSDCQEIER